MKRITTPLQTPPDVAASSAVFEYLPALSQHFANELEDWFGNRYPNRLVRHAGQTWFVKSTDPSDKRRNLLAWELGKSFANVAETRSVDHHQFGDLHASQVKLPPTASWHSTYLVRFAPDIRSEELPMSDWDSAMAIELVYSMWIRRRDAHSFNRSNVGGLPVFFDHGAAFHAERESRSIEGFFRSGDNPGCAGLWRMEQISADDCGTEIQRQNQRARFAKNSVDRHVYQPIRNPDQFHSALDRARDYIKTVSAADIKTALIKAGYHFPARLLLTRLLLTNQRRLDQELLKLKSILAPPTTGSGRHL